MRELDHIVAAPQPQTGRLDEMPDCGAGPVLQRAEPCRWHREAQFVVLAPGERVLLGSVLTGAGAQCVRQGQQRDIDLRATATRLRELGEIAREPVGDVDAGARDATQLHTDTGTRLGKEKAPAQRLEHCGRRAAPRLTPLQQRQPARGIARRTGDEHAVTGPPAGAQQRLASRHEAKHLHGDGERSRSRVAADELDIVRTRQIAEAPGERREPALVCTRQRQGEQRPRGGGAHGRDIAQVHRECAVADRSGVRGGREVHALDQRVDNRDEVLSRRRHEHRTVVADPGAHVGTHTHGTKVSVDQRKFGQRHCGNRVNVRADAARGPPDRAPH